MKYLFVFIVGFVLSFGVRSQSGSNISSNKSKLKKTSFKRIIDSVAVRNWSVIELNPAISGDGAYFMYGISNKPVGSTTMIIEKTDHSWRHELIGVNPLPNERFFTTDCKSFVFKSNDTLFFLTLGKDSQTSISNVATFNRIRGHGNEWLAFQLKDNKEQLQLLGMSGNEKKQIDSVQSYLFDKSGNQLLLSKKKGNVYEIELVDLLSDKALKLWSSNSNKPGNYSFDIDGKQIVFGVKEIKNGSIVNTIWYYRKGMSKAIEKVNDNSLGVENGLIINNASPRFSEDGRYIFFTLEKPFTKPERDPEAVQVDVWSYNDSILQSTQSYKPLPSFSYTAITPVEGNNVIRLSGQDEVFSMAVTKGDYGLLRDHESITIPWWPSYSKKTIWIVSLKDGKRHRLTSSSKGASYSFSPSGKYLIYYDNRERQYLSYESLTGDRQVISKNVPPGYMDFNLYQVAMPMNPPDAYGIAKWISDDSVLVYDEFDIWLLDPSGKRKAINLTNGYGRKFRISLRIIESDLGDGITTNTKENEFVWKNYYLITAFDKNNKYNGFYRFRPDTKADPELLTMGPWTFYHHGGHDKGIVDKLNFGMLPVKAGKINSWVIKRQSATEAPNYYLTKDFKSYSKLTDLQPYDEYNWLTTELLTWKQLDGSVSQGILYKPENFDSAKKYPVIFTYYEQLSHNMYLFPVPEYCRGRINIPWFVSQGYLVFVPDIQYDRNTLKGECVVNSVVSAARYMAKLSYVNGNRMGIQGHSHGGWETNYLITHTRMFAAAAEAAGISDAVSAYANLNGEIFREISRMEFVENGQWRMGKNFWQIKDQYISNSPILRADYVTTPLLMMHNKKDPSVPWGQAVEFYLSLRRLGKKVWMLQYDNGAHGVYGSEAKDYTIRITQFFDHYLKDKPAPRWMIQGIPAYLKGVKTGYEIDKCGSGSYLK